MYRLLIVSLILLYCILFSLSGQTDSTKTKMLTGKVIDGAQGSALSFVHIWNESTKIGGISNKSGEFRIKVKSNDTLVFSALGYEYELFFVSNLYNSENITISLSPKQYNIDEVVVRGIRTYESFKEEFLNLEITDSKTEYLRNHINTLGTIEAIEADRERVAREKIKGFGFTTCMGSGISIEKATQERISNLKKRDQLINEKFNRALVQDITQLSGDELTRFIAYCNFSDNYLFETDFYTIIDSISEKFNTYSISIDTIPAID